MSFINEKYEDFNITGGLGYIGEPPPAINNTEYKVYLQPSTYLFHVIPGNGYQPDQLESDNKMLSEYVGTDNIIGKAMPWNYGCSTNNPIYYVGTARFGNTVYATILISGSTYYVEEQNVMTSPQAGFTCESIFPELYPAKAQTTALPTTATIITGANSLPGSFTNQQEVLKYGIVEVKPAPVATTNNKYKKYLIYGGIGVGVVGLGVIIYMLTKKKNHAE
jgi:hypothetical protein